MGGASERPRGAELPAGVKPGHPHSILRDTLSSCGTSGRTLHGVKNWLDGRAQRAAANGATSGRRPVTSGVPGGPVLGPVLFRALIAGLDAGVECTASAFAGAAELGGAVGSLEGPEALRRGRGRWGPWAIISGTELNKNKCRILHLGRRKAGHKSKPGEGRLEGSPAERDLGVLVKRGVQERGLSRCSQRWCGLTWSAACGAGPHRLRRMFRYLNVSRGGQRSW